MSEDQNLTVEARIARFGDLKMMTHIADSGLPLEALDLLYARKILPVIAEGDTAVAAGAPIRGAGGMALGFSVCPPGQGPSLHRHSETFETFIVLEGEFEFSWGIEGDHSATLGKYDVVSFPPGVFRALRATGSADATTLVIINGNNQEDITAAPKVGKRLEEMGYREKVEAIGFHFGD
jgi:quercetin dioxygenase-like cupin family protein